MILSNFTEEEVSFLSYLSQQDWDKKKKQPQAVLAALEIKGQPKEFYYDAKYAMHDMLVSSDKAIHPAQVQSIQLYHKTPKVLQQFRKSSQSSPLGFTDNYR